MCPKGGTNCGRAQLKTTMADQADGAQEEVNVFIDLKTLNNGPHNNKKYHQSSCHRIFFLVDKNKEED